MRSKHLIIIGVLLLVGLNDSASADGARQQRARELLKVAKRHIKSDRFTQIFEDALCLVFLETQLGEFSERLTESSTLDRVLVRTWRKMSDAGREAALQLELDERGRIAVERALAGIQTP